MFQDVPVRECLQINVVDYFMYQFVPVRKSLQRNHFGLCFSLSHYIDFKVKVRSQSQGPQCDTSLIETATLRSIGSIAHLRGVVQPEHLKYSPEGGLKEVSHKALYTQHTGAVL